MAVTYKPLRHLLVEKGIKKLQLREMVGIGTNTLSKLSKDEYVSMEVIDKICQTLGCEISDVVAIVPDAEA